MQAKGSLFRRLSTPLMIGVFLLSTVFAGIQPVSPDEQADSLVFDDTSVSLPGRMNSRTGTPKPLAGIPASVNSGQNQNIVHRSEGVLGDSLGSVTEPLLGSSPHDFSKQYQGLGADTQTGQQESGYGKSFFGFWRWVRLFFNSKSTFSIVVVLTLVLLFVSLGISIFGYKASNKIVAVIIFIGSLFGYYAASEVYVLPVIVSGLVFCVFIVQQQEHEIHPIKMS